MREKIFKNGITKRLCIAVLTLAMLLLMLPVHSVTVYAAPSSSTLDAVLSSIVGSYTDEEEYNWTINLSGEILFTEPGMDPSTFSVDSVSVDTNTVILYVLSDGYDETLTFDLEDGVAQYAIDSSGYRYDRDSTPTHTHGSWGYTAENISTLIATCGNTGCTDTPYSASLTLTASSPNYSGNTATITVGTNEQRTAWIDAELTIPSVISYETSAGSALTEAPTTVGNYVAKVSPVGVTASALNTAKVSFTIEQAHGENIVTYAYDDTNHWHPCLRTDCTDAGHHYNTTAHSYDGGTHKCVCGKEDPAYHQHALGTRHNAVRGTCTTKGTMEYYDCSCGEKLDASKNVLTSIEGEKDPSNHAGHATTWTKTAVTHKEIYNCCGAVKTAEANHTYGTTGASGYTCTVCSYVDEAKKAELNKKYEEVKPSSGEVKDITNTGEATGETNPYAATIKNSEELESLIGVISAEKEAGVNIWLKIVDASKSMSADDIAAIDKAAGSNKVGLYLDATLFKKVGDNAPEPVPTLNGKLRVSFVVPENLRKEGRTYKIIRVHDGVATAIAGAYDAATHTLTFETDRFSSYALVYDDKAPAISDLGSESTPTSPKTGEGTFSYAWMILLISSLGMLMVVRKRKKCIDYK